VCIELDSQCELCRTARQADESSWTGQLTDQPRPSPVHYPWPRPWRTGQPRQPSPAALNPAHADSQAAQPRQPWTAQVPRQVCSLETAQARQTGRPRLTAVADETASGQLMTMPNVLWPTNQWRTGRSQLDLTKLSWTDSRTDNGQPVIEGNWPTRTQPDSWTWTGQIEGRRAHCYWTVVVDRQTDPDQWRWPVCWHADPGHGPNPDIGWTQPDDGQLWRTDRQPDLVARQASQPRTDRPSPAIVAGKPQLVCERTAQQPRLTDSPDLQLTDMDLWIWKVIDLINDPLYSVLWPDITTWTHWCGQPVASDSIDQCSDVDRPALWQYGPSLVDLGYCGQ